MSPGLRKQMLTQYPEWHKQPFRLSVNEMNDPKMVIAEFFESYSLPAIRACLKQWLTDSFKDPETEAADHFYTWEDVEKLVEAVWLIHQAKSKDKKNTKSKKTTSNRNHS